MWGSRYNVRWEHYGLSPHQPWSGSTYLNLCISWILSASISRDFEEHLRPSHDLTYFWLAPNDNTISLFSRPWGRVDVHLVTRCAHKIKSVTTGMCLFCTWVICWLCHQVHPACPDDECLLQNVSPSTWLPFCASFTCVLMLHTTWEILAWNEHKLRAYQ